MPQGRGYGFPRSRRLLNPEQFRNVLKKGKRIHQGLLSFTVIKNDCDYPRLGLTIAKRHVRKATVRNRIKRLIREKFRLEQSNLAPVDLIVMMKSPLLKKADLELKSDLQQLWDKIVRQWPRS